MASKKKRGRPTIYHTLEEKKAAQRRQYKEYYIRNYEEILQRGRIHSNLVKDEEARLERRRLKREMIEKRIALNKLITLQKRIICKALRKYPDLIHPVLQLIKEKETIIQ